MTGNVIGYLLLLTVCTAGAVFMDNQWGYMPMFVLVFALLLSLAYTFYIKRAFRFTLRGGEEMMTRGAQTGFSAEMCNDSLLVFPRLSAHIVNGKQPEEVNFSVSPRQQKAIEFRVCPPHIGQYALGMAQVRFYDPMGLFYLTSRYSLQHVTVLPRVLDLGGSAVSAGRPRETAVSSFFSRPEETDSYNGVREYQPGDSLKNIHWKLTAHTSRYMSRRYESNNRNGITVYADLRRPDIGPDTLRSVYDCVAESALSIAAAGVRGRLVTELVYCDAGGFARLPQNGASDIQAAAVRFSALFFGGAVRVEDVLDNERKNRQGYSNVFVCTAALTGTLAESLTMLRDAGRRPILVLARPAGARARETDDMLGYLTGQGIAWEAVSEADELSGAASGEAAAAKTGG